MSNVSNDVIKGFKAYLFSTFIGLGSALKLLDLLFSKYPVGVFVKNTHLRDFGNNLGQVIL